MSGELCLRNHQRTRPVDLRLLRRIVNHLLSELLAVENFDLTIHFVNTTKMSRLNKTHLRHTGSTDVITLDYSSANPPLLAGEIFVCVDEAVEQGRQFKVTWQEELVRYAVHAVLHLQGHDDLRPTARRRMKIEESRRLRQLARDFNLSKLSRKSKVTS
jgi:probable rRNA maturation factor